MKKILQKLDTVGLIVLLVVVVYSLTSPGGWPRWAVISAAVGGALVILGVAANYRQILGSLGKRSAKYASNYAVSVILVVALVAGLNYIGQRHTKRLDMTSSGRYTLAPQTLQVLDKLDKDLQIKAFFLGGDYPQLRELLVGYSARNRHVRYEFIDPDTHPEIAKLYEVTVYGTFQNILTGSQLKFGTLVLLYGDRREKIEKRSQEIREEDLTNAIIKVQRTQSKKVYFVEGHGEKAVSDTERSGLSDAKKALEDQNFKVDTVNLTGRQDVPPDAKVLALAGPTTEPVPEFTQLLDNFLNRGGAVLLMLDPPPAANFGAFLSGWGVTADNDFIVSPAIFVRSQAWPAVTRAEYESHRITDRFRFNTFFPLARSVQASKTTVAGVKVDALFKSAPESYGRTDMRNTSLDFDSAHDIKGPLPIALAVSKEIKAAQDGTPAVQARMVVVGDSEFAANAFFQAEGNSNLFLNMVSWLAEEEDLISIRPKPPEDRRIILSENQSRMLGFLTVILLPCIALVAGIVVWRRRGR